jgi:hypothetical protein
MTEESLTRKEDFLVIGVVPNRIDILKSIPGLEFERCWKNRRTLDIGGTTANFLDLEDLLTAKLAAGRPQDIVDAAKLKKALEVERKQEQASRQRPAASAPKLGQTRRRRKTRGPNPARGGRGPEFEQ